MMQARYLEVTFRRGRPVAAYFYLPRKQGDTSARTVRRDEGLLVDYSEDGRPIGIEITAPNRVTLTAINQILSEADGLPATQERNSAPSHPPNETALLS
jgi:uncharacterized protein YuzE